MIVIRDRAMRGRTQVGWLDSRHTFSFGGDRDPAYMGFGALRVVNDDRVAPGGGFGNHAHQDMDPPITASTLTETRSRICSCRVLGRDRAPFRSVLSGHDR